MTRIPTRSSPLFAVKFSAIIVVVILNLHMARFLNPKPPRNARELAIPLPVPLPAPVNPSRHYELPPRGGIQKDIVKAGDYIYYREDDPQKLAWDAAPIVLKSHKLIFFTIPKAGCTVWKQLFRRMMGHEDWQSQENNLPHDPTTNGLEYLYNFSLEEASEMMTSPEWTRVIMIREPKERFLSAFLDKAVSNDHKHIIEKCCPDASCVDDAQTIQGFLNLVQVCHNEHWRHQSKRMEMKFWPYVDYVLHLERAEKDARRLLERIGAWEEYGKSGWADGSDSIFQSKEVEGAGHHATHSKNKFWVWYTPETERSVEAYYTSDYEHPLFNFDQHTCVTCQTDTK